MIPNCDTFEVLELLATHDEFMNNLNNVAVFCENDGKEAVWLADYKKDPLSKKPTGDFSVTVFTDKNLIINQNKRPNLKIHSLKDLSKFNEQSFDFAIAVDTLRYSVNPFETIKQWNRVLKYDAMLCLNVPQTVYIDDLSRWQIHSYSYNYFSWNIVNLIQCLAVNGFDCRDAHFKQQRHDPWIWAAVYKSKESGPLDPCKANWYDLRARGLTPVSLDECIDAFGYVRHEFLKVEWLNHSVYDLSIESVP